MSPERTSLRSSQFARAWLVAVSTIVTLLAARAAFDKPAPDTPPPITLAPGAPASPAGLTIAAARPQGPTGGTVQPAVTFSRPMVAIQSADDLRRAAPALSIEPNVAGEWRWLGSATLEFVPQRPLPLSTAFTVIVPKGVRSADGATLAETYRYSFETARPSLYLQDPPPESAWVEPHQVFELSFDQPVSEIASHVWLELLPVRERLALRLLRTVDVATEERQSRPRERWMQPDRELPDARTRYALKPERPLPLDTALELVVDGALAGQQGPLTVGAQQRMPLRTYGTPRVTRVECGYGYSSDCPYGPLTLTFNNPIDVETLESRIAIDPPLTIDWERSLAEGSDTETNVSLIAGFKPGTRYRVRITPGVADRFGQRATEHTAEIVTSDLAPELFVERDRMLIEADGDGVLPVRSVNLETIEAEIWRLTPQELTRAGIPHDNDSSWYPARAAQRVTLDVKSARNATRFSALQLRREGERSGIYLVRLQSPQLPTPQGMNSRPTWRVLAQVTDLAVHAKLGPASGLAWVTSIGSGKPIGNAQVELYDSDATLFFSGVSNSDGLLKLPGLASRASRDSWVPTPAVLVLARRGDELGASFSMSDEVVNSWSFGLPGGWDGQRADALGFVAAERGIYRPGDTVHLFGIARYRQLGVLQRPPAGTTLTLQLNDARGSEISKESAKLTVFGSFSAELEIPKDARLGYCAVTASGTTPDGQALTYYGSLRVEEYRAPQFLVDVRSMSAVAERGATLSARASARYLFGGAMAGADLSWTALRSTTSVQPPGWDAYAFGVDLAWWDDDAPTERSEVTASGRGAIGTSGEFAIDAGVAETPGDRPWRYTVEAEVVDVSRQRVADRTEVVVHPAAAYAGLRVGGAGFAEEGKPVEVAMIAAAPEGALIAGADLSLTVTRRVWKSIRKRSGGERWETVTEPVEEPVSRCQTRSAATPVTCRFTPPAGGLYVLDALLTDQAGNRQRTRTGLYALGSGWVSWQRDDTDRLDLILDKPKYDVGDTARILVKSPFPASEAVLTVEREGVSRSQRVTLDGSARALEVPIDESMVPNVFVSVVLVRGRVATERDKEQRDDPGRPAFRIGYAELNVEKRSKRLSVSLASDKREYRPRQRVTVDVQIDDSQGRGVKSGAVVWAVDEGVLRLTAYQPPEPIEAIHPRRDLSVRIAEPLANLIRRRWFGEKGLNPAGGGGGPEGGELRRLFKTTPLFAANVETDASGHARVSFELPDNLTTYRVMAMGMTDTDRFGLGEQKIVVNKPLLLQLALPRVARVGDRFEAGVVVHTTAATSRDVDVSVEVAEGLQLQGSAQRRVTLLAGRGKEVRFAFTATAPGIAMLRFRAQSGSDVDSVEQTLPVRTAARAETVTAYGETNATGSEAIRLPKAAKSRVKLTLASSAMAGYSGALQQLVDYPYGCAEQVASRLVPFVTLRQLQRTFGLDPLGAEASRAQRERERAWWRRWFGNEVLPDNVSPDAIVDDSLAKLRRLQLDNGGLQYWSDDRCGDPWATAWGLIAAERAQRAGYNVDPALIAGMQRYLAEQVAPGTSQPCGWRDGAVDEPTRVMALWALSRSGAPKGSYYAELFAHRASMPLFSRAMLADLLLQKAGDIAMGQQALTELLTTARETTGTLHFQESDPATHAEYWSSDTRTTALVLMLLADHQPAHPYVPKLVRWLAEKRTPQGGFRNTQEAAYVLLALSELLRTTEHEAPEFEAIATLGGRELVRRLFHGHSLDLETVDVSPRDLEQAATGATLSLSKQGIGTLYYSAQLRYVPDDLPTEPLDRGIIVQRWIEAYAGRGERREVRAGDLLRLKVRVATPAERRFVAVDIPLPSGLEAVDASLATSARAPAREFDDPDRPLFEESYWSPFGHRELRDDRVVAFADLLPAGVHELEFVLRATTPGSYVFAPAGAEEMYAPETFGRTSSSTFTVTP